MQNGSLNPAQRLVRAGFGPLSGRVGNAVKTVERLATPAPAAGAQDELRYWIDAAAGRAGLPGPLWETFGRWQRTRLFELGDRLGLASGLVPGEAITGPLAAWCARQRVVEIGPGPHPAVCEARWRSAIAVDPLADRYLEHGLVPPHADRVVWIDAPGERIPLASGSADLVICENCLDHVRSPEAVVREMRRLLREGGLVWVLVDMMDEGDELHPHPFDEARVRALFAAGGFEVQWAAVWDGHSHPRAHGQWRALLRAANREG